jgi:hypothetical protein
MKDSQILKSVMTVAFIPFTNEVFWGGNENMTYSREPCYPAAKTAGS